MHDHRQALKPTRWFIERGGYPDSPLRQDEDGFILRSPLCFDCDELLERQCTLVSAPPWIGKTYVAGGLGDYLEGVQPARCTFRTDFAAWQAGAEIAPSGWKAWIGDQSVCAVWIIDGLEEGQARDVSCCPRLLRVLRDLNEHKRSQLTLIIFARGSELHERAPTFAADLRTLYQGNVTVAELLPLDAAEAERLVRHWAMEPDAFERGKGLIRSNRLKAVAPYPAALRILAAMPPVANCPLTTSTVWQEVLEALLADSGGYHQGFQTHREARFAAAARIGAVLTLCGLERIGASSIVRRTEGAPTLQELVPPSPPMGQPLLTRGAAAEALSTAMFRRTADSYEFAHRNVREWMAAFALKKMPLTRLRPPLTRVATAGVATIAPGFEDLARMLGLIHEDQDVRDWVGGELGPAASDLFLPDASTAALLLDRLEELALRGAEPRWVADPGQAEALYADTLDVQTASRLLDPARALEARLLLLKLGRALNLPTVARAASSIAGDRNASVELRVACGGLLVDRRDAELLRGLDDVVTAAGEPLELVARLIAANVDTGRWSVSDAFSVMPRGWAGRVIDFFRVLPRLLAKRIERADCRRILAGVPIATIVQANAEAEAHTSYGRTAPWPWWETYLGAVVALLSAEDISLTELRLLMPLAMTLGESLAREGSPWTSQLLRDAFASSREGRRELVVEALKRKGETPDATVRSWVVGALQLDDLQWLVDRLEHPSGADPELWRRALRLAEAAEAEVRERLLATARKVAPEVLDSYERYRAREADAERAEAERKARAVSGRHSLEELNRRVLVSGCAPSALLHSLARLNFVDAAWRPRDVVGDWADLSPDLRDEVLERCATALSQAVPTPIPDGVSIPGEVLYEGYAFAEVLRASRQAATGGLVTKWLPAALASLLGSTDVLERCWEIAPGTTEGIAIDRMKRELQIGHSGLLDTLPEVLWTPRVFDWATEGVTQTGQFVEEARAQLLEFVAGREPSKGIALAKELTSEPASVACGDEGRGGSGTTGALRTRATDILLALDAGEGLVLLEALVAREGAAGLENLRSIGGGTRPGLGLNWRDWSLEQVAELARILSRAYPDKGPTQTEAEDEDGWSGELVSQGTLLLWELLEYLANQPDPKTRDLLSTLGTVGDRTLKRMDGIKASRESEGLKVARPGYDALDVASACHLLDEGDFRIVKSASDLLDVVEEQLLSMGKDVGADSAIFYPPRTSGRHGHEDILNTYAGRRLSDRLPGKVLAREVTVSWQQRPDLVIAYSVEAGREPVAVTVEGKWSDNEGPDRGISTSLVEKLGTDYLIKAGRAHGVFLVGWSGHLGKWRDSTVPEPESSHQGLRAALEEQARIFKRNHPQVDIRVVVWDLERPASQSLATPKAAKRPKTQKPALGDRP